MNNTIPIPDVPKQGPPPPALPPSFIDFEYPGYWSAMDWSMKLFVNGEAVRVFSFKNPDKFSIPVAPGEVRLRAKLSFRSDSLKINVEPGKRYQVFLTYNRLWGSISLHLRKNR